MSTPPLLTRELLHLIFSSPPCLKQPPKRTSSRCHRLCRAQETSAHRVWPSLALRRHSRRLLSSDANHCPLLSRHWLPDTRRQIISRLHTKSSSPNSGSRGHFPSTVQPSTSFQSDTRIPLAPKRPLWRPRPVRNAANRESSRPFFFQYCQFPVDKTNQYKLTPIDFLFCRK